VRYRTKQGEVITVDAFEYKGELSMPACDKDFDESRHTPEWVATAFISGNLYLEDGERQLWLKMNGVVVPVPVGSYIVQKENGEIAMCPGWIFKKSFEPEIVGADRATKNLEFEKAVKPIHDWICKYGDPYTAVVVMQDRATVHQEYMITPLPVPD